MENLGMLAEKRYIVQYHFSRRTRFETNSLERAQTEARKENDSWIWDRETQWHVQVER